MDVESPSTELSKLGAEALRDLYNNLAGVKAFALEQAPDVCRQMIQWEMFCSLVAGAALIVLVGILVLVAPKVARIEKEKTGDPVGTWLVSVVCALFTIVLSVDGIVSATKAAIAPKLFLLEKITAMLKGLS